MENEDKSLKFKTIEEVFQVKYFIDFYHNNSGYVDFNQSYPEILFQSIGNFDEHALEERQKLVYNIAKTLWGDNYLMSN